MFIWIRDNTYFIVLPQGTSFAADATGTTWSWAWDGDHVGRRIFDVNSLPAPVRRIVAERERKPIPA